MEQYSIKLIFFTYLLRNKLSNYLLTLKTYDKNTFYQSLLIEILNEFYIYFDNLLLFYNSLLAVLVELLRPLSTFDFD